MQSFNIRKQLFGGKSVNQKPGLFALAVAARHRRGLRLDGTRSYETDLPLLQKLLRKQGADELNVSHSRLDQGGLAVSHWQLVRLRIANIRIELLAGEAIDGWKVVTRLRISPVT